MEINENQSQGMVFKESRVNRGSLIISNVSLLGKVSANGRTYSDRAMKDAVRLYEGVSFYIDHPTSSEINARKGVRSVRDLAGKIQNVRLAGSQVRGDLHLLDREPTKSLVFAIAEQMPEKAGNSHRAEGKVTSVRGQQVVESLSKVHAVELVTQPATTAGLFESAHQRREELTDAHIVEWKARLFGEDPPLTEGEAKSVEAVAESLGRRSRTRTTRSTTPTSKGIFSVNDAAVGFSLAAAPTGGAANRAGRGLSPRHHPTGFSGESAQCLGYCALPPVSHTMTKRVAVSGPGRRP